MQGGRGSEGTGTSEGPRRAAAGRHGSAAGWEKVRAEGAGRNLRCHQVSIPHRWLSWASSQTPLANDVWTDEPGGLAGGGAQTL